MGDIIKEVLKIGLLPTILLIAVFLIVQDPDRAVKLKSIITEPFFKIGKWFSKEYISSTVSSNVNEFFKRNLYSLLTDSEKYNIKIKWVTKPTDPLLDKHGTLILRLKEDNDQTKNIISAVHVALPHIVCPLFRNSIHQSFIKSIDLTILQKLSYKLGKHGQATFKKYFLDPETNEDKTIGELIRDLFKLDTHGFFVPIFLNELELIGEGIFANNDSNDYTKESLEFVKYLLSIVNRERGENIELNYLKNPFNVGAILLAKAQRADNQGVGPYLNRLRIKLDKGCESIYIVAFAPAFPFFDNLLGTLESHERVFIKNIFNTNEYEVDNYIKTTKLRIALLRKNDIYVDETFQSKIEASEIEVGKYLPGIIDHISKQESLVNMLGLRAYINRKDCAWTSVKDCNKIFEVGKEYQFQVKSIDKTNSTVNLTRRFDNENPWILDELPKLNEEISLKIVDYDSIKFTCLYDNKLELYIPTTEVSWFFLTKEIKDKLINTDQKAKVIEVNEDEQKIFCGIKQIEDNPWPIIHKSLPKGTELNGKVIEINHHYVDVTLQNGYKGRIPKESFELAGYEYKNYEENLVIGQGLDVSVTKVFIAQQKIRLDLKRNKK